MRQKYTCPSDIVKAALIFVIIALGHFILAKWWGHSFFIHSDVTDYIYPILSVVKRHIDAGESLWWMEESFGGISLLFQGSWDLKLVPWLFFSSVEDTIFLHASLYIAAGGLAAYLFFRKVLGVSPAAAIFASFVWLFHPNHSMYFYYFSGVYAALWVPLQALCIFYMRKRAAWCLPVLALSFADQMLCGRFQEIEAAICALVLSTLMLSALAKMKWNESLVSFVRTRLLGALFSGLVAVLLVFPFVQDQFYLVSESARIGIDMEVLKYAASWQNFFPWRVPGSTFSDGWEIWMGLSALLMVFLSLFKSEWWRSNILLFGLMILGLWAIYDLPLFGRPLFSGWVHAIPFHSGLRYADRCSPIVMFLLCILVARGMHALVALEQRRQGLWAVGIFAAIAILSITFFLFEPRVLSLAPGYVLLTVLCFIGPLVSWAYLKNIIGCNVHAAILVLLYFVNVLTVFQLGYQNPGSQSNLKKKWDSKAVIEDARSAIKFDRNYRAAMLPQENWRFGQSLVGEGILYYSGYFPMMDGHFANYVKQAYYGGHFGQHRIVDFNILRLAAYRLAGVRYWFAPSEGDFPFSEQASPKLVLPEVWSGHGMSLYEDVAAVPWARFLKRFVLVNKEDELRLVNDMFIHSPNWYQEVAIVLDEQRSLLVNETLELGQFQVLERKSDFARFAVDTPSGGFLTLTDRQDFRRWRCKLDGKDTPCLRVNGYQAGIYVPPGRHEVERFFHIPKRRWLFSFFGLCLLIGTWVFFNAFSSRYR